MLSSSTFKTLFEIHFIVNQCLKNYKNKTAFLVGMSGKILISLPVKFYKKFCFYQSNLI